MITKSKKPTLQEFIAMSAEQKASLAQEDREELESREAEVKKAEEETEEAKSIKEKYKERLNKKREIFLLVVGDKKAWLKTVDRKIMSMATTLAGGDAVQQMELMLDALWLEGDPEIREDDEYFIPAMRFLQDTIQVKNGELKKF